MANDNAQDVAPEDIGAKGTTSIDPTPYLTGSPADAIEARKTGSNDDAIEVTNPFKDELPQNAETKAYSASSVANRLKTFDFDRVAGEGNGHITKEQLVAYARSEARSTFDGGTTQLGLDQMIKNFDKIASSKEGISKDDLAKYAQQKTDEATVGYLLKDSLTDQDQHNLEMMHYYALAPADGAKQFAEHYNALLANHNGKDTGTRVKVGDVTNIDPKYYNHESYFQRMVTVSDSEGKEKLKLPMQVTDSPGYNPYR